MIISGTRVIISQRSHSPNHSRHAHQRQVNFFPAYRPAAEYTITNHHNAYRALSRRWREGRIDESMRMIIHPRMLISQTLRWRYPRYPSQTASKPSSRHWRANHRWIMRLSLTSQPITHQQTIIAAETSSSTGYIVEIVF